MPNRDSNNKNISIHIPDEFRKRIDNFIEMKNKSGIEKMTVRLLITISCNEYIDQEENK